MPQLSPLLWLNIFVFTMLMYAVMVVGSYFSMSTVEVKTWCLPSLSRSTTCSFMLEKYMYMV
nr:ATP synthase 8 [Pthirus gorillae]